MEDWTALFLLLALALLLTLPSPWNVVGAVASIAVGVFEVVYWQRRLRRQKVATGAENLVGSTGEITEAGQVRVQGELWQARSLETLAPGTRVRVTAIDGLTLAVEPADAA